MKRLIPLTCCLVLGLAACKKNDPPTPTELLAGRWRLTAQTSTYTLQGFPLEQNVFNTLAPCKQDDFTLFNGDGTVSLDEGATTCNAGDPQTAALGNWTLDETGKILTRYDVRGNATTATVTELTALTLKTSATDSVVLGPLSYRSQTMATYTRN